jgi:outer membrane biosynthesis protein TonB
MSMTKMSPEKWQTKAVVALLLFAALILLSACGAAEPTRGVAVEPTTAPTEPPAPTSVPTEPPEPTDVPTEPPEPTEVPTEPPPTDTPAPTETPEPVVVDDSACITCHTDEETLKALAEEPEAAESLSEGEG